MPCRSTRFTTFQILFFLLKVDSADINKYLGETTTRLIHILFNRDTLEVWMIKKLQIKHRQWQHQALVIEITQIPSHHLFLSYYLLQGPFNCPFPFPPVSFNIVFLHLVYILTSQNMLYNFFNTTNRTEMLHKHIHNSWKSVLLHFACSFCVTLFFQTNIPHKIINSLNPLKH